MRPNWRTSPWKQALIKQSMYYLIVSIISRFHPMQSTCIFSRVPAHRLLLSSTSDYFCAMFSTPMKESTQTEIALQNIKGQTLKELVEFSYDGSIALNEKNVQDLLEAAVEYQFPDIVQLCCEFMYDQLAVDNCIGFYLFAKHFMLDRLSAQALEMICKEFEQVSLGDEFKQMPFEPLKNILNMDALNIVTEVNVFNAVKLWALFDENRKGQLSELLKYVRFTQLDAKARTSHPNAVHCSQYYTIFVV